MTVWGMIWRGMRSVGVCGVGSGSTGVPAGFWRVGALGFQLNGIMLR